MNGQIHLLTCLCDEADGDDESDHSCLQTDVSLTSYFLYHSCHAFFSQHYSSV